MKEEHESALVALLTSGMVIGRAILVLLVKIGFWGGLIIAGVWALRWTGVLPQ